MTLIIIGWLATIIETIVFLPQLIKVLKSRSTKGLSKFSFTVVAISTSLWQIYPMSGETKEIEPWCVNLIIMFLMCPIIYFLFQKQKAIYLLLYVYFALGMALSIFLWTQNIHLQEWLRIIIVALGGLLGSAGWVPQIISIIKTKIIGEFSLLLAILNTIALGIWTIYWSIVMSNTSSAELPSAILTIISTAFGTLFSAILIYLYFKYKNKAASK